MSRPDLAEQLRADYAAMSNQALLDKISILANDVQQAAANPNDTEDRRELGMELQIAMAAAKKKECEIEAKIILAGSRAPNSGVAAVVTTSNKGGTLTRRF